MAYPYKKVFGAVERALFDMRSPDVEAKVQREKLDLFKNYATRKLSDDDYFAIMVKVVFYSGFRAETVKAKEAVIFGHFPDLDTVAGHGKKDVKRVLLDTAMIRN